MNIEINPKSTGGTVFIPPSKSVSHRAIIAAALANGTSRIDHVLLSQDIKATLEAIKDFGASFRTEPEEQPNLFTVYITGTNDPKTRDILIDCVESGSTLRFILPIIALDSENTVITGKEGLAQRPIDPYLDIFDEQGFEYEKGENNLPLILTGELKPGTFKFRGDISSQFITGLLFALPLLDKDSEIILTTKLESKPYVTLTIEVLEEFGIEIEKISDTHYIIPGDQSYRPTSMSIQGDFSQAAFWFVNGLINSKTRLENLPVSSNQGDYQIINILNSIGGKISFDKKDSTWSSLKEETENFTIDVKDTPDLVPILSIVAALSEGYTTLTGIKRLRLKESDRVLSTITMLENFGVDVAHKEDSIVIKGQKQFNSAVIDSFNDHRIAITAAIASGRATGKVTILEAQCVNKSYPNFWEDFKSLGGDFNEFNMG